MATSSFKRQQLPSIKVKEQDGHARESSQEKGEKGHNLPFNFVESQTENYTVVLRIDIPRLNESGIRNVESKF